MEHSPPRYVVFDFENETKIALQNLQNTTFEQLANDIPRAREPGELTCTVPRASDDVPPIENVEKEGGLRITAKAQVGKLIIKYEKIYVSRY